MLARSNDKAATNIGDCWPVVRRGCRLTREPGPCCGTKPAREVDHPVSRPVIPGRTVYRWGVPSGIRAISTRRRVIGPATAPSWGPGVLRWTMAHELQAAWYTAMAPSSPTQCLGLQVRTMVLAGPGSKLGNKGQCLPVDAAIMSTYVGHDSSCIAGSPGCLSGDVWTDGSSLATRSMTRRSLDAVTQDYRTLLMPDR